MAEKIDELVNKVISLETEVSSQTALTERLRPETDNLQSQIQILEDEKAILISSSESKDRRMKETEKRLLDVRDLNANIKAQNSNLQTHFTEVDCNLEHLSEKVHFVVPDDEHHAASLPMEIEPLMEHKSENSIEEPAVLRETRVLGPEQKEQSSEKMSSSPSHPRGEPNNLSEKSIQPQPQYEDEEQSSSQTLDSSSQLATKKQNIDLEEPNWLEMFMKGIENQEKTLLTEYTTTLRNYKEVKRKLLEVEKRNNDGAPDDIAMQLVELKSANASKDEEIRALCKKLSL